MRKNLVFFTCLFFTLSLLAQKVENKFTPDTLTYKMKYVSLGAKLGIPNIAAGNLEIVIPILDNHFAPFIDYSKFKVSPKQKGYLEEDDTEVSVNYYEYGISLTCDNRRGDADGDNFVNLTDLNAVFAAVLAGLDAV